MSWEERIKQAAWTSPSGKRFVWIFENVSVNLDKKGSAWEFPDSNGQTFVQDLGVSGRRFPMRMIFSGADHDLEADIFLDALSETGISKLEHPRYGEHDVAIIGTISERDDLKTAANQTIFEFTAWKTIRDLYDFSNKNLAAEVLRKTELFNEVSAAALAAKTELDNVAEIVTLRDKYRATLTRVSTTLAPLYDSVSELQQAASAVEQSISQGLNTLVGEPLLYAQQLIILMNFGARAELLITNKLNGYENMAKSIIDQLSGTVSGDELGNNQNNSFQTDDLVALSAVTGQALSIISSDFVNQQEAILAADNLLSLFDEVVVWRDQNYENLGQIDEGDAYQAALEVVQTAAGYLIEESFALPQQRSLVLTGERTLIDLAGELFGEIDSRLDQLIIDNQLIGDEIFLIPKGRQIFYYL